MSFFSRNGSVIPAELVQTHSEGQDELKKLCSGFIEEIRRIGGILENGLDFNGVILQAAAHNFMVSSRLKYERERVYDFSFKIN